MLIRTTVRLMCLLLSLLASPASAETITLDDVPTGGFTSFTTQGYEFTCTTPACTATIQNMGAAGRVLTRPFASLRPLNVVEVHREDGENFFLNSLRLYYDCCNGPDSYLRFIGKLDGKVVYTIEPDIHSSITEWITEMVAPSALIDSFEIHFFDVFVFINDIDVSTDVPADESAAVHFESQDPGPFAEMTENGFRVTPLTGSGTLLRDNEHGVVLHADTGTTRVRVDREDGAPFLYESVDLFVAGDETEVSIELDPLLAGDFVPIDLVDNTGGWSRVDALTDTPLRSCTFELIRSSNDPIAIVRVDNFRAHALTGPEIINLDRGSIHQVLQHAINQAEDGDTLLLGKGTTYGVIDHDEPGKHVTIKGQGPGLSILSGIDELPATQSIVYVRKQAGLTLTDLSISGWNGDSNRSGVIAVLDGSDLKLARCVIENNTTAPNNDDGVLFVSSDGEVSVENSIIRNNATGRFLTQFQDGSVRFTNCLIAGNETEYGTIFIPQFSLSHPEFINCTFAGEDTGAIAFAFAQGGTSVTLTNCVLDGAAPYASSPPPAGLTLSRCVLPGAPAGNTDAMPLFVNAAAGDYRLAAGSPGIDAADSEAYEDAGGRMTDLAGSPRVLDDPATTNTGVGPLTYLDAGAYEFNPDAPDQCIADLNGDGILDLDDINIFTGAFINGCP